MGIKQNGVSELSGGRVEELERNKAAIFIDYTSLLVTSQLHGK